MNYNCSFFYQKLLSKDGYFISIDAKDFYLPSGELVETGAYFRKMIYSHLFSKADLFLACDANLNVFIEDFCKIDFKQNDIPKWKIIVEGPTMFTILQVQYSNYLLKH